MTRLTEEHLSGTTQEWVWVPFTVDKKYDGYRIDRFLASRLASYTRARVQKILEGSRVTRNDKPTRASAKVRTGDNICVAYPRTPEAPLDAAAQVPILFEDESLLIVDKPAGLLSHPTDKVVTHTLLGYLRHSRPAGEKLHLLHRLDRETSGVLALAKNPEAARRWTRAMERHQVQKEYVAFVHGRLNHAEGFFDQPIGRENGAIKVRQWVDVPGAVTARTRYTVKHVLVSGTKLQRSASAVPEHFVFSVVRAHPETGRLHQIRVHFAAAGYPLLGDPLYTGMGEMYQKMVAGEIKEGDRESLGFPRTALHAAALRFKHPISNISICVEAPIPPDMANLLDSSR